MLKILRHFISHHSKEFVFLFFILIIEGLIYTHSKSEWIEKMKIEKEKDTQIGILH